MRIDRDTLPEIIDAIEQDGNYFGIVKLERGGNVGRFKFGVSQNGYSVLKKIMQLRPFDQTPGVSYRYFFYPSVGRTKSEEALMSIRVEQGAEGKNLDVEANLKLAENLMWFYELNDLKEAEKLVVK